MVKSIDLSQLSITDANELIRQCGAAGEDVDIVNPDARHNIGVGLVHPINVRVKGSGGYFCAGLTDLQGREGQERQMSDQMKVVVWRG